MRVRVSVRGRVRVRVRPTLLGSLFPPKGYSVCIHVLHSIQQSHALICEGLRERHTH